LRKPQMDREISTGWQTEGNKRDRAELRDQKVLKFLQGGGWNAFFRIDFLPIWKTLDQYSSKILTDVRSFWKTKEISWKKTKRFEDINWILEKIMKHTHTHRDIWRNLAVVNAAKFLERCRSSWIVL
jgi:hypothetical protein